MDMARWRIFPRLWRPRLLLLTAVYIIWEAFNGCFFREGEIRPSFMAIVILTSHGN